MSEKILYKKKYDKTLYAKENEEITTQIRKDDSSFQAFLELITEDTVYVRIPEKEAMVYRFVQDSINFSNEHRIDIEVAEAIDGIEVHFSFDDLGIFTHLKDVIARADDILIIPNADDREVTLTLLLQTHKALSRSQSNEQNG